MVRVVSDNNDDDDDDDDNDDDGANVEDDVVGLVCPNFQSI